MLPRVQRVTAVRRLGTCSMSIGLPAMQLICVRRVHGLVPSRDARQTSFNWQAGRKDLLKSPCDRNNILRRTFTITQIHCSKSESSQADKEDRSNKSNLGQYAPQKLSEDILTIPNVLTTLRLLSTPILGWWVLQDQMSYALALLAVSGTTDVLDGYLARRFKSATVFGSIADPAADKALMTVMVGALAYRGLIPFPLVVLIIGRDVGLVLSAFIIRWRTLPEPKTLSRYWNPRLPSAKVQPTQVSKYNTFLQIILVGLCTLLASMNDEWRSWWSSRTGLWHDESTLPLRSSEQGTHAPIVAPRVSDWGDSAKKVWHAFMIVVAGTTIWSGVSYLSGSGAIRYANRSARVKKGT